MWGKLDSTFSSTLVLGKSKSLVVILFCGLYLHPEVPEAKVSLVDHDEPPFILLLSGMKDFKPLAQQSCRRQLFQKIEIKTQKRP